MLFIDIDQMATFQKANIFVTHIFLLGSIKVKVIVISKLMDIRAISVITFDKTNYY